MQVTPEVTSAQIFWQANVIGFGRVEYGETTAYGQTMDDTNNVTDHSFTLTGLQPATTYYFQVSNRHAIDGDSLASSTGSFTTSPANRPPSCAGVTTSPSELQRDKHDRMKLITLSGASDPDGDLLSFHIDAVTQDEAVADGPGPDTFPDAQLSSAGADANEVLVRAERNNKMRRSTAATRRAGTPSPETRCRACCLENGNRASGQFGLMVEGSSVSVVRISGL